MERTVNLHIEKLAEGLYLATSEDLPGLVAQGRTIQETLEIARDVATKLMEVRILLPRNAGSGFRARPKNLKLRAHHAGAHHVDKGRCCG